MSFLPIGSVVGLHGQEELVMIYGLFQKNIDTGKASHYIGCKYPVGITDTEECYLFDNKDISKLYYLGFQDAEALEYKLAIKEHFKNHPEEKKTWPDFE